VRPWLGVCALLGGGSVLVAGISGVMMPLTDLGRHPFEWYAAGWFRQPWTLWTSAWVHTSIGSLGGNLLAIGGLAVVGAALGAQRPAALALLVAWPLGTLALLLWPEVTRYSGLGGPIHAAAAVLGMHVARRPAFKPFSPLLFAALGLKLLVEHAWTQPVAFDPSWGFNVVYAAHLTGTLAGAACGGVAALLSPRPEPHEDN
jgi:hypothetical protein